MSFKMKGSPAKMGTIQGTAGHSSALKMKEEEENIKTLLDQREASRKKQEELEAKEEKRDAKRESGKKVFLGKLKTKINKKKVSKEKEKEIEIQKKINVNPDAIKWKEDAEKKNAEEKINKEGELTRDEVNEMIDREYESRKTQSKPPSSLRSDLLLYNLFNFFSFFISFLLFVFFDFFVVLFISSSVFSSLGVSIVTLSTPFCASSTGLEVESGVLG